jgi:hypothetical protein
LRLVYFVVGLVCLGLGVLGYILPLMPGTVFLIVAAACFARSSPAFEAWLLRHPRLGPAVLAWRNDGAIARPVKLLAVGAMALSFVLLIGAGASSVAFFIAIPLLAASALFVATRPEGPRDPDATG